MGAQGQTLSGHVLCVFGFCLFGFVFVRPGGAREYAPNGTKKHKMRSSDPETCGEVAANLQGSTPDVLVLEFIWL